MQTKLLQISLVSNRPILVVPLPFPGKAPGGTSLDQVFQLFLQQPGLNIAVLHINLFGSVADGGRVRVQQG